MFEGGGGDKQRHKLKCVTKRALNSTLRSLSPL